MRPKFRRFILTGFAALMTCSAILPAQAEEASALIAQGDQQWAAGKLDLAQKAFEQAVGAEPRSVGAHMKLAGLQLYRQEFKACIETYQQTIGLDAKNAKAWLGLGFAYLHTGKNDLSLAAFNEAIRIDPGNQEKLAPVLAKLGAPPVEAATPEGR
jgi:tetratricopeptide (TPR) repeat protein